MEYVINLTNQSGYQYCTQINCHISVTLLSKYCAVQSRYKTVNFLMYVHISMVLVQERRNSRALAVELSLSCTNHRYEPIPYSAPAGAWYGVSLSKPELNPTLSLAYSVQYRVILNRVILGLICICCVRICMYFMTAHRLLTHWRYRSLSCAKPWYMYPFFQTDWATSTWKPSPSQRKYQLGRRAH